MCIRDSHALIGGVFVCDDGAVHFAGGNDEQIAGAKVVDLIFNIILIASSVMPNQFGSASPRLVRALNSSTVSPKPIPLVASIPYGL